jgi:hypothetical protein
MSPRPINPDPPETPGQAAAWERVKNHAMRYGLCHRCAAQLAWGAQLGYARVEHPPCSMCAPLVEALPVARPNGWRTPGGSLTHAEPWSSARRLSASPGTPTPGEAHSHANASRSHGIEAP